MFILGNLALGRATIMSLDTNMMRPPMVIMVGSKIHYVMAYLYEEKYWVSAVSYSFFNA